MPSARKNSALASEPKPLAFEIVDHRKLADPMLAVIAGRIDHDRRDVVDEWQVVIGFHSASSAVLRYCRLMPPNSTSCISPLASENSPSLAEW